MILTDLVITLIFYKLFNFDTIIQLFVIKYKCDWCILIYLLTQSNINMLITISLLREQLMHINSGNNFYSLCVFGHRDMTFNEKEREYLYDLFEDMIVNKNIHIFLFGGFGGFDDFCHEIISELKKKYPQIKRVYVCEFYKYIERPNKRPAWLKNEDYEAFEYYEMNYTGFYQRIYFRNCEIIDHSDFCVFCVDENNNQSGAKKALEYAKRKKKNIINVFSIIKQVK